ncbi:ADP-ribosyltransferase [Sporolactobacillus sp. Y61]|uniref:ADP-ribosyltransferase n=1 Tax=Sporolactobacillus sp. Y61 TaxID=3160863 RepID=A0AAU8III9_9BACL
MKLPQDITVYRGTDSRPFEQLLEIDQLTGEYNWHTLIGKTFKEYAFLSTSVEQRAAFNHLNVSWEINLPKGTTGGMLNQVSNYPIEAEFLLNAGQEFLISDTKVDSFGNVKVIMDLILNSK